MIRSLRAYFFGLWMLLQYYFLSQVLVRFSFGSWEVKRSAFFRKKGQQTRDLFLELGGVYIKLGQFLSNLFHVFPEEFLKELEILQDKVPPHPFSEMEKRWGATHSQSLRETFPDIETIPIASASIGQVHRASWNGRAIAIKILYPGIEAQTEKDLKTIHRLLYLFETFVFAISYNEVSSQLQEMIRGEVNFKHELQNLNKMRKLFAKDPEILIPEPILEFCTSSVLVTEFVFGFRFRDLLPEKPGSRKNPYFEKLIKAYMAMFFEFRFFHADPHPGNLILLEDGRLCFIDFGAVQEISLLESELIEKILLSGARQDYITMAEGLYELKAVKPNLSKEKLIPILQFSMERLRSLMEQTDSFRNLDWEVLNPQEGLVFLQEIQVGFRELMRSLALPPKFLTIHRVLALLLGISSYVDPYKSFLVYAEKPFYQTLAKTGRNRGQRWKEQGEGLLSQLLALPKEALLFFSMQNSQRLPEKETKQTSLVEQFVYGILGSVFFFFGSFYTEKSWKETGILFFCMAGLAFWSFAKVSIRFWR